MIPWHLQSTDELLLFEPCTTISRLSFSFLIQSKQTITNFNFQNFSAFFQKNFRLLGGGLPPPPVPLPLAIPLLFSVVEKEQIEYQIIWIKFFLDFIICESDQCNYSYVCVWIFVFFLLRRIHMNVFIYVGFRRFYSYTSPKCP
jgi:hypothetical protein